jgi:hypothetical protein
VINPMEVGPMDPNYPRPLLERVSCAIDRSICPDQWLHQDAARAAIREVAAWLDTKGQHGCFLWLRREAGDA